MKTPISEQTETQKLPTSFEYKQQQPDTLKRGQQQTALFRRVHFIGVGGSGMAAIALVAHRRGICVSGSDLKESEYVQALLREGVSVVFRHDASNVDDPSIELVVVSTAIPEDNPELMAARARGITVWPRARMLAYLGEGMETLAVAGTHGKTTTTSMLSTALVHLGADPTFLVGGVVTDFASSAHVGSSSYYVVEADESDGSFICLNPRLAIITNIEADHLDYFKSIEMIRASFAGFLTKVADDGLVVACADNLDLYELVKASGKPYVTYGKSGLADVRCVVRGVNDYTIVYKDGASQPFTLGAAPGAHNMLNATAVAAALDWLGFDRVSVAGALASFAGVHRRFERIGTAGGVLVVDDYGHHPTEIAATLQAAAELGRAQVHVLFQPHRYTRTQAFLSEFACAFDAASSVTLMEIYSAGEAPIPGVNSNALLEAIRAHNPRAKLRLVSARADIVQAMTDAAQPGDLIITMGAGDVTTFAPQILAALEGFASGGIAVLEGLAPEAAELEAAELEAAAPEAAELEAADRKIR